MAAWNIFKMPTEFFGGKRLWWRLETLCNTGFFLSGIIGSILCQHFKVLVLKKVHCSNSKHGNLLQVFRIEKASGIWKAWKYLSLTMDLCRTGFLWCHKGFNMAEFATIRYFRNSILYKVVLLLKLNRKLTFWQTFRYCTSKTSYCRLWIN